MVLQAELTKTKIGALNKLKMEMNDNDGDRKQSAKAEGVGEGMGWLKVNAIVRRHKVTWGGGSLY